MDERTLAAKKDTLLMIPYGLYILGATDGAQIAAGTINWVTQTSFTPPLIAMGVKKDSSLYEPIRSTMVFALSFLASGQKDLAFSFFRKHDVHGDLIGGHRFETHQTGAPIIAACAAWVEGRIVGEIELGDHACMVGEITNAGKKRDASILTLEECGVKYGG